MHRNIHTLGGVYILHVYHNQAYMIYTLIVLVMSTERLKYRFFNNTG